MYNSKVLFSSIFFSFVMISCKNTGSPKQDITIKEVKIVAAVSPAKASLAIEGMTCAIGCAKTIEKNLSQIKGVQKAIVDFDTKTAVVDYDATLVSPKNLTEKVVASADGKTYSVSKVY